MSDLEGREPDILDLVAAPEARECQLYGRRGEPEPCDNQADWLFVYDGRTGDETVPRNALACDECFNAPVETDGGRPEGVEHHPDGFHSGEHYLDPAPEPEPTDPSNWCYECGDEAHAHRCICGMPLCHRHQETQAGFCSDHVVIETRVGQVPACVRPDLDGGLEVVPDAPGFNYSRPARQRLAPSTIEQAVRDRLPGALIEQAQAHVQDALEELEMPAKEVAQLVLNADDACAFALASEGDRQETWLRFGHQSAERARELMGGDQLSAGMDLGLAVGLLEQLGADRGGDD